jgi:hypothetical protein
MIFIKKKENKIKDDKETLFCFAEYRARGD